MYGLTVGDALAEYEGEVSLQILRRSMDIHANEDARRTVRLKSIISRNDVIEVLDEIQEHLREITIEVSDYGDHYQVDLSRTIRRSDIDEGEREITGSFALFNNPDTDIWTAITGEEPDFFKRGVLWLFNQSEPRVSEFYVDSSDLERILDRLTQSLSGEIKIRVDKAVAYTRRGEGTISFETNPYKEVFQVSSENDKFVDKISFDVVRGDDKLFSAFLSRDGESKFTEGNVGLFFDELLVEYAGIGQQKADLFSDKERSRETGDVDQLQVEFDSDVFRTTDDHTDLIQALSDLSRSSLTVYHDNPYAHLSVLDFTDGSSCDVFVTAADEVTLMPSYKGSLNSLMRISEQISREFDEGTVTDIGKPEYGASDFFS